MNEDWLHKIHDRMSDYETDAPDRLWEAIEEKLAPAAGGQRPARRRTILIRVRRGMAAAAMLALAISLCFYLLDGNKETELRPILSAHAPTASDPRQHDVPSGIISKQLASLQAPQPTPTAVTSAKYSAEVTEQAQEPADTSDSGHSTMPTAIPETDGNDSLPPHTADRPRTSSPLPVRSGIPDNRRKNGPSSRNLSIAMFSSGATGSMSARRSPAYLSGAPLGADYASWKDTPMLGLMLFNKGRRLDTKVRHNIPVRAGITVGYSITSASRSTSNTASCRGDASDYTPPQEYWPKNAYRRALRNISFSTTSLTALLPNPCRNGLCNGRSMSPPACSAALQARPVCLQSRASAIILTTAQKYRPSTATNR